MVSYNLCLSQKKVIIKATQLSISDLAPMASFSVVANATGSPATPTAVKLGIGLTFDHGLLAVDTAHFKDTIFAVNGLQVIGASFNTIGLGGRLQQNTNVSGANAWAMTIDSMQAASGRGFRVNFMSDAGWDLPIRDSATGFWTRIGKGNPGDVLTMLGAGGVGWGPGGGGGGAADVVTTITSGTSSTVPNGTNIILMNMGSITSAYSLTFPATPHTSNTLTVLFGGTVTTGAVITTLTSVANSGQTLNTVSATGGGTFGEPWIWKFYNNVWYRIQ